MCDFFRQSRPASLKGLVIPVALEDLDGHHEITHCSERHGTEIQPFTESSRIQEFGLTVSPWMSKQAEP